MLEADEEESLSSTTIEDPLEPPWTAWSVHGLDERSLYVPRQGETVNLRRGRVGVRVHLSRRRSSDRCYANPNQRSRRVEPKRSFSTRISADAPWKCPVGFGPDRKFTSTFPIALAPNSM
jgi:hypothetical protein